MTAATLRVNGQDRNLPHTSNATLQFALRDDLGLSGTRFGCGVGQCGCCTVLVDGQAVRSCQTQVASVVGKEITTIEGLGTPDNLHPLQQAWIDAQAPQCGYCQPGQIMEAAALLQQTRRPQNRTSAWHWRVTSAAAVPTTASSRRSSWLLAE